MPVGDAAGSDENGGTTQRSTAALTLADTMYISSIGIFGLPINGYGALPFRFERACARSNYK